MQPPADHPAAGCRDSIAIGSGRNQCRTSFISSSTRSGSSGKICSMQKRERAFSEISGRMNIASRSEPNFSTTAEKIKITEPKRQSISSKYASPKLQKKGFPTIGGAPRRSTPGAGNQTSKNVSKPRISSACEKGSIAPTTPFWGSNIVKSSSRNMASSTARTRGEMKEAVSLFKKSTPLSRSWDTAFPQKHDHHPQDDPLCHSNKANTNLLRSAFYWLEQVKHAESIQKHDVSLGFFRLALECDPEPLQMLRDELISYKRKYGLCSEGVTQILSCYGITEEGQKLDARGRVQMNILDSLSCTLHSFSCSPNKQKTESHPTSVTSCEPQPSSSVFGSMGACMPEIIEMRQTHNIDVPPPVDESNWASNQELEFQVQSSCRGQWDLDSTSKTSEPDISSCANVMRESQQCKIGPETQQCKATMRLPTLQSQSCQNGLLSPLEVNGCERNDVIVPHARTPRPGHTSSATVLKPDKKEWTLKITNSKTGGLTSSQGTAANLALGQDEVMEEKKHQEALNIHPVPLAGPGVSSNTDQPSWFRSNLVPTSIGSVQAMDVDTMMKEVVSGIMLSMDDCSDKLAGKEGELFSDPYQDTTVLHEMANIDIQTKLHLSNKNANESAVSAQNQFTCGKAQCESIAGQGNTIVSSTEKTEVSSFFEGIYPDKEAAYVSELSLDIWNPDSLKEKMGEIVPQEDEAQSSQIHLLLCPNTEPSFDDDAYSNVQQSADAGVNMPNSALNAQIYANSQRKNQEKQEIGGKANGSSEAYLHGVAVSSDETAASIEKSRTYVENFCSNTKLGSNNDCLAKDEMAGSDRIAIEPSKLLAHSVQKTGLLELTPTKAVMLSSSLRTPSSRMKSRAQVRQHKGMNDNTKLGIEDPSPNAARMMARTNVDRIGANEERLNFSTGQSRAASSNQGSPSAAGSTRSSVKRGMQEEKPGKQVHEEGLLRDDSNSQSVGTPGSAGLRRSARLQAASPAAARRT